MTATSQQIEALMDFLTANPDLARGPTHGIHGQLRARRLWEGLTNRLNNLGGAVKTVLQWRKVWADRKYLAKKANAAARRSAIDSGGGPETVELSENDMKIISILGERVGEQEIPAFRVQAFPEQTPDPIKVEEEPEELESPSSPPRRAPQEAPDPPPVRRRRRRLRPASQLGMCSKVLRLEKEKKNVLVGIRDELMELNRSLNILINKF